MSKIRFVDLSVHANTIAVAQRAGEIRMTSFRGAQRLSDGSEKAAGRYSAPPRLETLDSH